jgi:two-component system chemotaxis sensor kinase CheA
MEELTREEIEQLLSVFRDQAAQIIDQMSQDLIELESGVQDQELIGRLRRAAHTLKGDASCIGLGRVAELAHKMEDVFEALATTGLGAEPGLMNLLFESIEEINRAVCGQVVEDLKEGTLERLSSELQPAPKAAMGRVAGLRERAREYVRVEASRLDALMNLAGEMIIVRSLMNQLVPELERSFPRNDLILKMSGSVQRISKLIAQLQNDVLAMRMVPINQVFRRYIRPIRELASELGKRVQVEFFGADTELDRALVDLVYEPLLHLLRNAVDHGLEPPAERQAAGKPQEGKIRVRAFHQGSQIVIQVSDDGRGIDPDKIRAKVERAREMSDQEALELIFQPGFSTADQVTMISGRGVGLSAVKSFVEGLRGELSLSSQPGLGTTFELRLPIRLAIMRALLFVAGDRLFALPLLAVEEVLRLRARDLVQLEGFESYRLRDRYIGVVRVDRVLNLDLTAPPREEFFLAVLSVNNRTFGLIADQVLGEQELVLKAIAGRWVQSDVLLGASILGDGRVVLILDGGALLRKATEYERSRSAYA